MLSAQNHLHPKMYSTDKMKLTSSASEQNVYFTYVCLVDDLQPTRARNKECDRFDKSFNVLSKQSDEINQQEAPAIQVERTKALYELVESSNRATENEKAVHGSDSSSAYPTTTSGEENDSDIDKDNTFISCDNPNILKLTKMKWLTEDPDASDGSSSPSLSSVTSNGSTCSKNSECDLNNCGSLNDKYLSTILRLDKEHNMFGLSSIAIIGPHQSKQKRTKDDERAVFHQTAIVQVCCGKRCCKNVSVSDLPASLKCGACRSCCFGPFYKCGSCKSCCFKTCGTCSRSCVACDIPCGLFCNPVCSKTCCAGSCPRSCPPAFCKPGCNNCFGLKVKVNRKPPFEPPVVELTPRNSSVLQKPILARTCHHTPECIPPSDHFPYLMPCFWPASSGSPCSEPANCFHTPPCPAPRTRQKVPLPPQYTCPKGKPCFDKVKNTKCTNEVCPGNSSSTKSSQVGHERRRGATCNLSDTNIFIGSDFKI